MSSFKVLAERCDQCLFSADKIVSNARRKEVLADCMTQARENFFVCHKTANVCCRGFYDSPLADRVAIVQVARRLGLVEFVPVPGKSTEAGFSPAV